MKFPSVFKPLVRALSSRSSIQSSISRSSSAGSTASRASSLSSLDDFETMKAHLAWHGNAAAADMLTHSKARGLMFPKLRAKKWGKIAIALETHRVQNLFAQRGDAERDLIRSQSLARNAQLKLRQAERQHGTHSLAAHEARKMLLAADRSVQAASIELHVVNSAL